MNAEPPARTKSPKEANESKTELVVIPSQINNAQSSEEQREW
jgi:hypothetical protein